MINWCELGFHRWHKFTHTYDGRIHTLRKCRRPNCFTFQILHNGTLFGDHKWHNLFDSPFKWENERTVKMLEDLRDWR